MMYYGDVYFKFSGWFDDIRTIVLAFWIYALVDVVKSDFKDPNMKLIWIIVLLFANPIGPFVYFGLAKNQKGSRRRSNYFNR